MSRVLTASFAAYAYLALGVFLAVSPWTPLWNLATEPPSMELVRGLLRAGWLRGAVTGLGLLNLWAAVRECRRVSSAYRDS